MQGFSSSQIRASPARQTPCPQISAPLQTSPSSHELSSLSVTMQPSIGSHNSSVHGFRSSQSMGTPSLHTARSQYSSPLQTSSSPHSFSSLGTEVHPFSGSHTSSVQGSLSSHPGIVSESTWQTGGSFSVSQTRVPLQTSSSSNPSQSASDSQTQSSMFISSRGSSEKMQTPSSQASLVHGLPSSHSPQLPPQVSSPHSAALHWGAHTQAPSLQTVPESQLPHSPPQPSAPQSLPAQSGSHDTHSWS